MITPDTDQPQPRRFVLNEVIGLEETRQIEFKEVAGMNPVSAITNAADEYAVAFLNSEGGTIFWGVRDSDRVVVGVPVSREQRDQLRREVANKLHSVQPQIDPTRFHLEIHPVHGPEPARNLVVVELVVPKIGSTDPFYTGGQEAFVRVDGVKKKLSGPQLTDWIKARSRATGLAAASVADPRVSGLISRVKRILTAHGLEPSHLARFLKVRRAPFTIELTDFTNDGAFLAWLTDDKIDWIANTFLIRREWIDGEDERIHEQHFFDKHPGEFFATVSRHVDVLVWEDVHTSPAAYFIRWGKGKEWRSKGESGVFVVLAVPLARFSNERMVFKYISDFTPYPWDYARTQMSSHSSAPTTCPGRKQPADLPSSAHGRQLPHRRGQARGPHRQSHRLGRSSRWRRKVEPGEDLAAFEGGLPDSDVGRLVAGGWG